MNQASLTKAPIKVLLVDDHRLMRRGLRLIIEGQEKPKLQVVGEASNADEALQAAEREQPDIILLDLDLGGESGLDVLPRLLEVTRESKVIVLTAVRDPEMRRQAVMQGAMGLVVKEMAHDVLLKAIEKVYQGESWFDRALTGRLLTEMRRRRDEQENDPEAAKIATLTAREHEVIKQIGEGLNNKQIADRLCLSETTVRHHLTSIFSKLEVSDRLKLIIYAYRHGLATPPK